MRLVSTRSQVTETKLCDECNDPMLLRITTTTFVTLQLCEKCCKKLVYMLLSFLTPEGEKTHDY